MHMSLNDELSKQTKSRVQASPGAQWIKKWYASLAAADQKTWDAWLNDPTKAAAVMFRVIRSKGYPSSDSTFRRWVQDYREQKLSS